MLISRTRPEFLQYGDLSQDKSLHSLPQMSWSPGLAPGQTRAFKNCIDIVNEWVKIPFHGVNDEIFLLSLLTTTMSTRKAICDNVIYGDVYELLLKVTSNNSDGILEVEIPRQL